MGGKVLWDSKERRRSKMKQSNSDRLVKKAIKGRYLPLAALDVILEGDNTFDDHVEMLNVTQSSTGQRPLCRLNNCSAF